MSVDASTASSEELEYVGFWPRVWASVIDIVLSSLLLWPLLSRFYGSSELKLTDLDGGMAALSSVSIGRGPLDFFLSWVAPALAVLLFWVYRQATPGKMAIGARIVDARTGGKPGLGQLIGRYLAYYVSIFPFCLGLLWVGIDARKQGWHDKLAGTVVVRRKGGGAAPVRFGG
ncbi:MAG: RDD family protein [Burkholderiaceae bacterium]